MKYLTLLRHAKSSHSEAGIRDIARPLNERGRTDAATIGAFFRSSIPVPGIILGSTAERVRETLEILRGAAGEAGGPVFPEADLHEALYLSEVDTIWDYAYAALLETDDVWLCAHNPAITEAVEVFSGTAIDNVPTLGVARIGYSDLSSGPSTGELLFYDVPKNHRG